MQGDDPPFLPVGTDVSAKYKGAFCEAKIKKVVRNIKCKVSLKSGGSTTVQDDVIKGNLRVGSTVEVKQDPKRDAIEAVITKIQDCSQYTVVFDDGDITTLRRSALCLKSGRHFNESETLDQLPLTHPEHFSTPVIAGRRGRRGRAQSDESEGEPSCRAGKDGKDGKDCSTEREPHVGRVVLVEAAGGGERRRPHQPAFPALVVAPTAQIKVKEDYLVRSFKDGRYYTVPKKEACEFRAGGAPLDWAGVEAALQYLNNGVLPPHWDRETLFSEPRNTSDDSSDDEPREEKDHFVAQLYKFMDDRGTPLNRNPTIANKDIDLYRLFRVVQKLGGYNRVTNQNQWKTIADKMGFHPVTTSITNLCKQAYKKFLHSFEEFYRKLGVTLVAHPRGARTPPAGRSLIRDRDKLPSTPPSAAPLQRGKDREKDSDKSETDKSEKEEKAECSKSDKSCKSVKTPRDTDGDDSADNQPLAGPTTPKIIEKEKEKPVEKEKEKEIRPEEKPLIMKPRSESKTRSLSAMKIEIAEKRTPKPRRPLSTKGDSGTPGSSRSSRRPHMSTDSDSSGRASRCGIQKKMQSRRSQSANSCSSGNTIASSGSKRARKRKTTEPSTSEPRRSVAANIKAQVGDKLKVYYGPTQSESKVRQKINMVTYEAKVTEISPEGMLRVHYTGWNTRYDEWIKPQRIALNVSLHERTHSKKNISSTRRVRAKRAEESLARTDSDSDSDSEREVKRLTKKSDDKSGSKTPSRSKDSKSSDSNSSTKSRKRPIRTSTTSSPVATVKKSRPSVPPSQGRDYDLNEIRSELKGLHTVKQEIEDIKQEVTEKEVPSPPQPLEPPQPEKQPEDVYEFKEPEPFELELHDDKKKRTHRIFDDISPNKYTSTLSKSLSEEISEDPLRPRPSLRSPSLSPFRDFPSREVQGRQSPEDDSKDALFSMDDDSFPGDGSGLVFEGFTPAKNQETYSKKSKVSKLRELIDDSPDSPADDEQSSDDDRDDDIIAKNSPKPREKPQELTPNKLTEGMSKAQDIVKEEPKEPEIKFEKLSPKEVTPTKSDPAPKATFSKDTIMITENKNPKGDDPKLMQDKQKSKIDLQKSKPELQKTKVEVTKTKLDLKPAKTPETSSPMKIIKLSEVFLPSTSDPYAVTQISVTTPSTETNDDSDQIIKSETSKIVKTDTKVTKTSKPEAKIAILDPKITKPETKISKPELTITKPEPKTLKPEIMKMDIDEKILETIVPRSKTPNKLEIPSSPLVDTEEDKSEPDSPARIDVLPEPPPGFLLHSEGPKIAEKLLKAINSAKRLSMSPPPVTDDRPKTPKKDALKVFKSDSKTSLSPVPEMKVAGNIERVKTPVVRKTPEAADSIFGEPSKFTDAKRDITDVKKVKPKEATPPRLQSPLSILERRKSVADLPLAPGKNNKVLSDTIQKLSSQINQAANISQIPLPPFQTENRSESTDSDDSERRLVIDKTGEETWRALPPGLPPRSHALAGKSPGEWSAGESLLMLEDACKNERKHSASVVVAGSGTRVVANSGVSALEEDGNISLLLCSETIPGSPAPEVDPPPRPAMPFASASDNLQEERRGAEPAGGGGGGGEGGAGWGRRDDTSHADTNRERRPSDRDSPLGRKEDDNTRNNDAVTEMEKPLGGGGGVGGGGGAARAAAGAGAAPARRGRRPRRDTDEPPPAPAPAPAPAPPLKYNFYVDLDPSWDSQRRINLLTSRLADVRKAYHTVKADLAAIDRRRKKLRRKEREAVKAAKAACS